LAANHHFQSNPSHGHRYRAIKTSELGLPRSKTFSQVPTIYRHMGRTDTSMNLTKSPNGEIRLLDETIEPIAKQPGFAKHHAIPDAYSQRHIRFVADISKSVIEDDLETMFATLRKEFGLKRRQLSTNGPNDGCGVISTPYFDYEISVNLHPDKFENVIWQRTLSRISDPDVVLRHEFEKVFGTRFAMLELQTESELDLASIVDFLEDAELENLLLDYDREVNWCEITMGGLPAKAFLRENLIRISVIQRFVGERPDGGLHRAPGCLLEGSSNCRTQPITWDLIAAVMFDTSLALPCRGRRKI
jgi:hypothetical protein